MVLAGSAAGLASGIQDYRHKKNSGQSKAQNHDDTLGYREPGITHSIVSPLMQFFVRFVVERSIVKTFLDRQFDTVYEFDIRTFVDFTAVTCGEITN